MCFYFFNFSEFPHLDMRIQTSSHNRIVWPKLLEVWVLVTNAVQYSKDNIELLVYPQSNVLMNFHSNSSKLFELKCILSGNIIKNLYKLNTLAFPGLIFILSHQHKNKINLIWTLGLQSACPLGIRHWFSQEVNLFYTN